MANTLSKHEFRYISHMMEIYAPWFISKKEEQEVLSDVLKAMRRRGCLEFPFGLRPLWSKKPTTTEQVYKDGRRGLKKAGVLIAFPPARPFGYLTVRVNALTALKAIRHISMKLSLRIARGGRIRLDEMIYRLEEVWKENGWEEEPIQIAERILHWISHFPRKKY